MASSAIRISIENTPVCAGDEFVAHVFVDAPGDAINAAQGSLIYNTDHLTPIAVRYGDSFLTYWVTPPGLPEHEGSIPFTGGLPFPGFQGVGGKVMSVVFRADAPDVASMLSISRDAQVLLNDGQGTATDIIYKDGSVAVIKKDAAVCQVGPSVQVERNDTTPPLPFDIIIERSDKIFDGRFFAAFDTTDEESGVAHYVIQEASAYVQTPWLRTTSPYKLQTQGGDVTLFVQAIDGAGNVRISSVSQQLEIAPAVVTTGNILLLAITVIAGIILWILCRKRER